MAIFYIGSMAVVMDSDLKKLVHLTCDEIPGLKLRLSAVLPGLEKKIYPGTEMGQLIKYMFNILCSVADVSTEEAKAHLIQSSFELARALVEDADFDIANCIQSAQDLR